MPSFISEICMGAMILWENSCLCWIFSRVWGSERMSLRSSWWEGFWGQFWWSTRKAISSFWPLSQKSICCSPCSAEGRTSAQGQNLESREWICFIPQVPELSLLYLPYSMFTVGCDLHCCRWSRQKSTCRAGHIFFLTHCLWGSSRLLKKQILIRMR